MESADSGSLDSMIDKLERCVEEADTKLDKLSMTLDSFNFEKKIVLNGGIKAESSDAAPEEASAQHKEADQVENKPEETEEPSCDDDDDDDDGIDPAVVRELLVEIIHVKEVYNQLHGELRQVQELQQEVTRSLRNQMMQVQSRYDNLRERIIGARGTPPLNNR